MSDGSQRLGGDIWKCEFLRIDALRHLFWKTDFLVLKV
jgi:hypothetical protein